MTQRTRTTKEELTLFGARLQYRLPDGREVETGPTDIALTIEKPDLSRPSHAPDWSSVLWNGVRYPLTPKQRLVVCLLWRAWEDGTRFVSGAYLLERAESEQSKLWYLFRSSPAWGALIVPGEPYGGATDTYCLAPVQEAHP